MTVNQLFQLLGILKYYREGEGDENMKDLMNSHIQLVLCDITNQLGGKKK